MSTRIYHVNINGKAYLIEAASPNGALRHVVTTKLGANVEAASARIVALMMGAGAKVERANEPAPTTDPLLGE